MKGHPGERVRTGAAAAVGTLERPREAEGQRFALAERLSAVAREGRSFHAAA
jgi:hypothetical protein